ncbi:MAG: NAD(P)H-binding protein [Porticoccaceae bacterium]|nr:NAD(P)H-binding protein [Porticoccaceae bacterium]
MKKALVIGITGNFGYQMALSLQNRGWGIKALMRDPAKAPSWLSAQQIVSGSAYNKEDIEAAAKDCDLILYAANPAYHRWHQEALQMLEPSVQHAEKNGLRILLPGNVYNYSPSNELIDEFQQQHPPTDKGEIRRKMELRLKQASKNGAAVTIVRAGDFIGPNMHMGWLDSILKQKRDGYLLSIPHDEDHVHFWSYLPDLCENTVSILENSVDVFETYHDPGLKLSRADWESAFSANGLKLRIRPLPWPLFKVIGIFSPIVKEILKMRYLWREPVLLNGEKMRSLLAEELKSTEFSLVISELFQTNRSMKIPEQS